MASEKINREEIIQPENVVYQKPELLNDVPMHYCPGCSHGVVHKLVAEVIADMGMEEKAVGVSPVGCAVFAYRYIDIDWQEAAHGRAPALATAIKRLWPDRLVFTYQGDGDYHLHQQRYLWHDGWTDGSDNAHRAEDDDLPLWP